MRPVAAGIARSPIDPAGDAVPEKEEKSMRTIPWRHVLAGLLAAFFALGGYLNVFASPEVLGDYQRWGYPYGFNVVTGLLEWTSAILIAVPSTRLAGSALAALVMIGGRAAR